MRRIGCLKESFLTFDNLYAAFRKAYRGTKNNDSYKFCFHLERELFHLRDELAEGSYVPGAYRVIRKEAKTLEALKQINGFGRKKVEKYGKDLVGIVKTFFES